ncbi:hypothetical protein GOBAR_AA27862 [Gossypium barbadense]|uniref:F-box domain-containing protein n=1 Tax=Gossypium barbadense TaxID=3634 RepID=A0A2P5WP15_GOSBA|nr:hypothetical protein GOBAR_AA27862 [Gossypium barbadense]
MPRFEVPEALVMEILCKLPVKSLVRFNCVCKYWCSSFQTPCFISKHYPNSLKNNSLNPVLQRFDGNANIPYFSQLSFEVAIWNPSTREFKILPPSSVQRPTYPGLTCDFVNFDCGAFEFDSKTDDYKFIRFVTLSFVDSECETPSGNGMSQVELYSLKCDSWKEIPSPNYRPFDIYLRNTPYEKKLILSFDMANEKFWVSPIPEFVGFYPQNDILEVLVFNGSLGVIAYTVERTDTSFDLWVMNGEVWTKQFSIEPIPGVVLGINTYLDHHREYVSLFFFYVESLIPINGIQEHKSHIIRQLIKDASNKY